MPLTWDLTGTKDIDLIRSKDEWGITETLIFCTMHTGIGTITEANADEFFARVAILERLNGNMLLATRDGKRIDRPLTPLDIHRRIGLKTNASFKDETRASFTKRHIKWAFDGEAKRFREAVKRDFTGTLDQFEEPVAEQLDDVAAG